MTDWEFKFKNFENFMENADPKLIERHMRDQIINFIYQSNKLEGTLGAGVDYSYAYKALDEEINKLKGEIK